MAVNEKVNERKPGCCHVWVEIGYEFDGEDEEGRVRAHVLDECIKCESTRSYDLR